MKKFIALLLCLSFLFVGCAAPIIDDSSKGQCSQTESIVSDVVSENEEIPEFSSLSDPDLIPYLENAVYAELVSALQSEEYFVENVQAVYVSQEYLDELEYNTKANVYFGYTLEELDELFQGTRYVFALDENGQTTVKEFEAYDDTYEQVLTNVAIGTGVILLCVTVAIITKNLASSATAGKTVKMILAASTNGAKAGTKMALKCAAFSGTISSISKAANTDNVDDILKAGLLGASEGFKYGAIVGTVQGIANGIRVVGNSRYFPEGSQQALNYPEGVEFTKGADGKPYPRFEKWAKATAKFDTPTVETALNHTGLSGNYWYDAKLANAQCGFSETPSGYVWHHVEDMKTMILVPQDLHSVAMGGMSHTGGASLIKKFLGIE